MSYGQHINRHSTPQTEQAHPQQIENSAGGFTFQLSKWDRLDRFLILGNDKGTYYASEKKLTKENAACIIDCLQEDAPRTIKHIVEISDNGRAPKNDPAIFALVLSASSDDVKTRQLALAELSKVCRIGTHLFHFVGDVQNLRGWSRGLRRTIATWYNARKAEDAAFQMIKYQQRDGVSHRDLLRLSHAVGVTPQHNAAFRWAVADNHDLSTRKVGGKLKTKSFPLREYPAVSRDDLPQVIQAFEKLQAAKDIKTVVELVREYRLPHEAVPNEWKNAPELWEALLDHMGTTALIRNLAKMTSIGLLKPLSKASQSVAERLTNTDLLRKDRIHPMSLLIASSVYRQGHGNLGKLSWDPVATISDALETGFYNAFQTIEPTNKNWLLALDLSGSMTWNNIAGTFIKPREASAAMAMATARVEKNYHILGFSDGMTKLPITATSRLPDAISIIEKTRAGGTNCSLPIIYATEKKLEVDTFVVYTDNETYAGKMHPFQALKEYRQTMGRFAKLIVVGMTATDFTIADSSDPGMMDVVGFDTNAPAMMADFARQ